MRLGEEEMERVKGIEPSYSAWEAAALPLSYTRDALLLLEKGDGVKIVGGGMGGMGVGRGKSLPAG